jgi:hypothetical protein
MLMAMSKKLLLSVALTLVLLASLLTELQSVHAQKYEIITIKADGSVDPPTAPIAVSGNVYTLTSNIFGKINVRKFGIVVDGAGYTLEGNGTGWGVEIANLPEAPIITSYDVTVRNCNIKGFEEGIDVNGFWGNIINGVAIVGNNITNSFNGVRFSSYERYSNNTIAGNNIIANNNGIAMAMGHQGDPSGNTITGNLIADNKAGMSFMWLGDYYGPKPNPFYMNNQIYYNNFINNSNNVVNEHVIYGPDCANIWDNFAHHIGNYWSNYNGTDANLDGVGDTSYVIDANNKDYYPIMQPIDFSLPMPTHLFPPSVPEFTANYTDNVLQDQRAVDFTIKNQHFTQYYGENGTMISLYYNFRFKEHGEAEWRYYPTGLDGNSAFQYYSFGDLLSVPWEFSASNSSYTSVSVTLSILNALRRSVTEGEVDFQVQALVGHNDRMNTSSTPLPAVFFHFTGEASDWSNTQTVTIPYAPVATVSPTSSPSPSVPATLTPIPTPTVEPTSEPTSTPKQPSGFLGANLPTEIGYAIVAVLAVVAVAGLSLVYFRKHRKQKDG